MEGKSSEKQDQQKKGNQVDGNLSSCGVLPCPYAAVLAAADGQGWPNLPEDICSTPDNGQNMAVSVNL